MKRLYIKLQYKSTLTIFSYEINKHLSMELLQIFYFAKLLHCPADKTCKKIADKNTVLQPTPKGLAILHQFCLKMGIPDIEKQHVPKILTTEFNTMQLLEFDRHSRTDQIIHNYHSDKLIFIRIMGPIMNTWSSKNGPDSIKDLGSILKLKSKFKESNLYSSENANTNPLQDGAAFLLYLRKRQTDGAPEDENDGLEANDKETTRQNNLHVSPFHHRFFTNPDSDSHCQYYVSDKGIRFFKEKTVAVNGTNVTVTNCFSGKALVQYLMDCTDLMYPKDALKIATIFLSIKWKNYINSIQYDIPCTPFSNEFHKDTTSFKLVLKDPGLKYLFRNFMIENMCVENLDVYDDIVDFQKKNSVLKKMISLKTREKTRYLEEIQYDTVFNEFRSNAMKQKKLTIYTAINKLSEYNLSKVYSIFSMYISEDAPNEVNIDSKLRFEVQNYFQAKINLKQHFNEQESDFCLKEVKHEGEVIEPPATPPATPSSFFCEEAQLWKVIPQQPPTLALKMCHIKKMSDSECSPTEILFTPKIKFLDDVSVYFEEIKRKIYRIMERDSFAKFLESDQFRENKTL
ncbi:hypothetical protein CAS74_003492 [Pichia kudriavzevii]|uniref:Protein SST2 n=1 Tax=Pichia kudriavzevii TaxID=4909 RepID=A0A1Z8JLB9_PICKU|nr:hypothetical protein CAS74_003492 [Pichia kudriavzevii]